MTYPVENAEEMTVRVLRSRWKERMPRAMAGANYFFEPELRAFQVQSIKNLVTVLRKLREPDKDWLALFDEFIALEDRAVKAEARVAVLENELEVYRQHDLGVP